MIQYYSQSKQDEWVIKTLNQKKNGFFIDVGAYDGVESSNTLTLEKFFDWRGICIEGNPFSFSKLKYSRLSKNIYVAVSNYNGDGFFGEDRISNHGYAVQIRSLKSILSEIEVPNIIDYISLDIEGHELQALEGFDFEKYHVNLLTVEHNSYLEGEERKNKICEFLTSKGFEREVEDAPCLDPNPSVFGRPYEDWYKNKLIK
jgi:FkbM family methyltransferase